MASSCGSSQVRVTASWDTAAADRPVGLAGGSAAATAPVAALVSISALSASSVKLTHTLMVFPSSLAVSV